LTKSLEILNKYWGFDSFRPLQEEIVDSVIYGHDTLAILPTGGGKSICFQVPGLALEGLTIVISPLIALMEDQVKNLRERGIKVEMITSGMSYREIDIALDNARFGNVSFLYTSPERLKSELFQERCKSMKVSLITVDEAHCISEWGHDFRPAYREIALLRDFHPDAPVIALTASATMRVQNDISEQLALRQPRTFSGSLQRSNLHYKVRPSQNKLQEVLDFCENNKGFTGIVYCQTRRSVKHIAKQLRARNISAGFYHGGLNPEDRKYMLENWLSNRLKVMVATNAFGMGIDKPDVRYVLHFEIPSNLEAYYQEAGRAGRDGQESQAIAFWEQKDIEQMRQQLDTKYPSIEMVKKTYNAVCNFLKVAVGSGDQESYDFDIQAFHKAFSIPIAETYYALKILQLNGDLSFIENSFHPTRFKFAIGNSALYKFQVSHEKVASLISLLSRSYPGVYDRFVRIDESELINRLKITKEKLKELLTYLEKYGVADINFQSNLPKITLLHERLPEGYLQITNSVYLNRKKVEEEKLSAMISYITEGNCRQQMINAYFDTSCEPCGKCDVCVAERGANHSYSELIKIIPEILPASLDHICHQLNIDRPLAQRALHTLLLEETIILDKNEFRLLNS